MKKRVKESYQDLKKKNLEDFRRKMPKILNLWIGQERKGQGEKCF